MLDQSGSYSARAKYLALCDGHFGSSIDDILAQTWNLKGTPQIITFLWRLRNRLPSGDNLFRRNVAAGHGVFTCPFCRNHDEKVAHTLF